MKKLILIFFVSSLSALNATPIELSWSDNSDNEEGFEIERRIKGDGNFSVIQTWVVSEAIRIGTGRLEWMDYSAQDDTNYEYRVRPYNPYGFGAYTNIAEVASKSLPNASTNLEANPRIVLEPDPVTGAMKPVFGRTP